MEKNEGFGLRIGNWISAAGEFARIICISKSGISAESERVCYTFEVFEDINPIPLTEEIMNKCGFKCIRKNTFWTFVNANNFMISMWMNDKPTAGFEVKGHLYWGEAYLEAGNLHELQNLYFVVTRGKELEVNL